MNFRIAEMARLVLGVSLASGFALTAQAEERKVTYLCERGVNIEVVFAGSEATLTYDGQSAVMAQKETGSGYLYEGNGNALRGKEHEAIWTDAAGVERICQDQAYAMAQPQVEPPMLTIEGTPWKLVHFQSSDDAIGIVVPPRVERYTAEFMSDGALSMQLDCNRLQTTWNSDRRSADGASLEIKPGAMTRAACGEGALDSRIAADLVRMRSFVIRDGKLSLVLEADAGIYLWEPAAP
jgi:membrane-bound inhibitor of C-type lysozyme/heat shock protein HslJ